jgi:hypothetical protein
MELAQGVTPLLLFGAECYSNETLVHGRRAPDSWRILGGPVPDSLR